MIIINTEIINDKEYREITVRGRTKLIAKDGEAINPKRRRQKANRNNYNADNLEWVTHKENIQYTIDNNYETVCQSKQGVHNGRATFTEEQIKYIRQLYSEGNSVADIVRVFYPELQTSKQYRNIHSTFSNIVKNITWKNLL